MISHPSENVSAKLCFNKTSCINSLKQMWEIAQNKDTITFCRSGNVISDSSGVITSSSSVVISDRPGIVISVSSNITVSYKIYTKLMLSKPLSLF